VPAVTAVSSDTSEAEAARARWRAGFRIHARALAAVAVVLAACGLFAATAFSARVVSVGLRANGKNVSVRTGGVLKVSLPGNAETGFSWRLKAVERHVLRPGSIRYVPRRTRDGVGAAGNYVLRLRALRSGSTRLRMLYVRHDTGEVALTFGLRVSVAG